MQVSVHENDKAGEVGQAYDVKVPVKRVTIHPLAEEGQGVMRLYGEDGKLLTSIILKSMKRIDLQCVDIHPAIAALIPAPVQETRDEAAKE